MLDYHAQVAALMQLQTRLDNELAGMAPPDPKLVPILGSLQQEPSSALLGVLLDHIIEHTDSTALELSILEQATKTWDAFGSYLKEVEDVRQGLESLVLDPTQPDVVNKFNALALRLQGDLKPRYSDLMAQLKDLYDQLFEMKFIPPHGQAQDAPLSDLSWRDLIQSRLTGAMMSSLLDAASADGSQAAEAFAYGALARYAADVTGSSYVNNVVRGPRRSHLYRNRLARYTIGTWCHKNLPTQTPSLELLIKFLQFGSPVAPSLPPNIKAIVEKSLTETYGPFNIAPLPDLDKGYANMMRHLQLLTAFHPLPLPKSIDYTLKVKIVTQNIQSNSAGSSGGGGNATPSSDANSNSNPFDDIPWWGWVLFGVCIALAAACYFWGICGPVTKDPYPGPFQGPVADLNLGQTTQYLTSDDALVSVKTMFDLHCQLYSAAMQCLYVLKLLGLIYPETQDLNDPNFSQFTKIIPEREFQLPKRPIAKPDYFLSIPLTPQEDPQTQLLPFPIGSPPGVFLSSPSLGATDTLESYGFDLWVKEAQGGESEIRNVNQNLDADRGVRHECWQVKAGQSINDNPVPVEILSYNQV